jgi:hypothetical protein
MKRAVWKFPCSLTDEFVLILPQRAKILTFAFQQGTPTIWALVETEQLKTQHRSFRIAGTGHNLPEGELDFIDTIFVGDLVFHLFEVL